MTLKSSSRRTTVTEKRKWNTERIIHPEMRNRHAATRIRVD
jgi:hypothetical protein